MEWIGIDGCGGESVIVQLRGELSVGGEILVVGVRAASRASWGWPWSSGHSPQGVLLWSLSLPSRSDLSLQLPPRLVLFSFFFSFISRLPNGTSRLAFGTEFDSNWTICFWWICICFIFCLIYNARIWLMKRVFSCNCKAGKLRAYGVNFYHFVICENRRIQNRTVLSGSRKKRGKCDDYLIDSFMVLLSAFILSFKGSQWSLYYALGIYVIRELAASILIMWGRYVELLQVRLMILMTVL